jgi:2-isopropylmalate synthase
MSGASNVVHWLRAHGIEQSPELVRAVLDRAKTTDHILSDAEILQVVGAAKLRSG